MDDPPALQGMLVHRRHFLRRVPAPVTDFDSVLARTDDGTPWIVRGTASGGASYVLLSSPLHPDATRLPVSTGMVEFTDALVNRWARPGEPPTSRVAGETVPLPPRADSLAGPIGPSVPVEGGAPWTPRHAGIWRLSVRTDQGVEARYVGVNVPSSESDPTALGTDGARLEAEGVTIVTETSEWPDAVFARRRGRDARAALLPAVLLLLALEAILAAPRRRRAAGPQLAEGGR